MEPGLSNLTTCSSLSCFHWAS